MKTVPGSIPGDDRFFKYIGLRGLLNPASKNSRILWLIDGHTINESYFNWGFPDQTFGIDVDNIKKIEIIMEYNVFFFIDYSGKKIL